MYALYLNNNGSFSIKDIDLAEATEHLVISPFIDKKFQTKDIEISKIHANLHISSKYDSGGVSCHLFARLQYKGRYILEFDSSKLHILNNASVLNHIVLRGQWEMLFAKIIQTYSNTNEFTNLDAALNYIDQIDTLIGCDSMEITSALHKSNYTIWRNQIPILSHLGNVISDLISSIEISNLNNNVKITNALLEISKKYIKKTRDEFPLIPITDSRLPQISTHMASIHSFMNKHNHSSIYLNTIWS